MRRRTHPTRNAISSGNAQDSPGLRALLLRIAVAAALLSFGSAPRAQSGIITTVVGPTLNGTGVSGDSLSLPSGVAVSGSGASATIYTADVNSCVVWQTQGGQTSIYAGELYSCSGGSPGSAPTSTSLSYPVALALCGTNFFIATHGVDPILPQFAGQTETGGAIYEVNSTGISTLTIGSIESGGGPPHPVALACDTNGNVYLSAYANVSEGGFYSTIQEDSPSGGSWTNTQLVPSQFDEAFPAIAWDPEYGDLWAVLGGQVGQGWLGAPELSLGNIEDITATFKYSASPAIVAQVAPNSFINVSGLATEPFTAPSDDPNQNCTLYAQYGEALICTPNFVLSVASTPDQYSSEVEEVGPTNSNLVPDSIVTPIAGTGTPGYSGDGGPATSAEIDGVTQIVLDSEGDYYLADAENQRIRRIHPIVAGPTALTLSGCSNPTPCLQSSGAQFGSLQGVLNPTTGDFYYVSGANTVNVINTGSLIENGQYIDCPGCKRIVASIPVGANNGGSTSTLTMVVDPTQNFVYVSNTADGNLYVINGNPGSDAAYSVITSVALNNSGASLLAIDTGINEIYATGPVSGSVSAVQGEKGISPPALIGNYVLNSPVDSMSVDTASHTVFAVGVNSEFGGVVQYLYTMTPAAGSGALAVNTGTLSSVCGTLGQGFPLTNSIAADPQTGGLIVSGADYDDAAAGEYCAFAIFSSPETFYAPVPYTWQPYTTSLDAPDRVFYLTDFSGNLSLNNSNAAMVTGIDSIAPTSGPDAFVSTTLPVFGGTTTSPATATSPYVYDVEPDTTSYQAWISGSDATTGGFVELWDATSQAIKLGPVTTAGLGGGSLFVDSTNHAAYLLDHVNNEIWMLNQPPWTSVDAPVLTAQGTALQMSLAAGLNPASYLIYYTTNGAPPSLASSPSCTPATPSTCTVALGPQPTNVSAFAYNTASGTASNVTEGLFNAIEPLTSFTLAVSPNPATTGASITATATLSVAAGVTTVTGTVNFTADGVAIPECSNVAVNMVAGQWQAICPFTEDQAGSYSILASFAGDSSNQAGTSNTESLQVNQGSTPILVQDTADSKALAINANNAAGQSINYVLNNDTSVSFVQNGALTGQGCAAFTTSGSSITITAGVLFYDSANGILYLGMSNYSELYAAYDSINPTTGACTQGPLLSIAADPNSDLQLNVDVAQGNVYLMNYYGANNDKLYILPTANSAPWSSSTAPSPSTGLNLDYSAQYGVMQIDPSNHQVYINDLGSTGSGPLGAYATSGFFVYDPNYKGTDPDPVHVEGCTGCSGSTKFNVGTLLDNGSGQLVLINANPSATTANLAIPIWILNTTQSGFTFFPPGLTGATETLTPGSALTPISAASQYSAISAADINVTNPANPLVYVETFNASSLSTPGTLLQYNLAPGATTVETVLSSSLPAPALYDYNGPWTRMNYNPAQQNLVLSTIEGDNLGALAMTSPLCGSSFALTQLVGSSLATTRLSYPVVNTDTGYVYAVVPVSSYPTEPGAIDSVAPPASTCTGSQTYTIGGNVSGLSSGASVTLLDNGTGSLPVTANGPFTFATALASGSAYSVTVATQPAGEICSVMNGSGTVASANITNVAVTCVAGTPIEISTPALKSGIVGTQYTQNLAASGGSGNGYTWTVLSGNALSAVGLTLESNNGEIFGVPTATETAAPITIQVMDSQGNTAAMNYNLTIYPILGIGPSSLSAATVGVAYSQTFTATGGSGAGYAWTLLAGEAQVTALGLSLSSSGVLSGTPNAAGSVSFGIQVTDSAGDTAVGAYTLTVNSASSGNITINDPETITVNDSNTQVSAFNVSDPETITVTDIAQVTVAPPLTITTSSPLPQATIDQSYSETLAATGGSGSGYMWESLDGGSALASVGLALSTGGVISGTPSTTSAAITFTVVVTDSVGNSAVKIFVLTVGNPVPAITSTSPAYSTAGSGAFQLVVFGSRFLSSSTINWNGTALSTLLNGSLLSAQVPASDIASQGVVSITVVTPGPGGGASNTWQFEVSPSGNGTGNPPVVTPVTGSISPGSSATYSISLPAGATKISVQCLNLPSGASCTFANPTLTIKTSTSTPAGTYTIVAVFTYTVAGAASSSLIFLPLLLLPLALTRRRWAKARIVLIVCVALATLTLTNIGCGGGPTHQATSTTAVTMVVQ
jgi:hypothetical protein